MSVQDWIGEWLQGKYKSREQMEGAYALDRRADSLALGCEQEESISLPVFPANRSPVDARNSLAQSLRYLALHYMARGKGKRMSLPHLPA